MSKLDRAIRIIEEKSLKAGLDIDVFIRTNDRDGDGYAYIYKKEDDTLDVSYLQNRIPKNAWKTRKKIKRAYYINDEGKQSYSYENDLEDAIEAIAKYWLTVKDKVKLRSYKIKENETIQLVIELTN